MTCHRTPACPWSYLLALVCLIVITILAPPAWHAVAKRAPMIDVAAWPRRGDREQKIVAAPAEQIVPALPTSMPVESRAPTPAPLMFAALDRSMPSLVERPASTPLSLESSIDVPTTETTPPSYGPPVREPPLASDPTDRAPDIRPPAPAATKLAWWPVPEQLNAELENLAQFPESRTWATRVRGQVDKLRELERLDDPRLAEILDDLEILASEQATLLPLIPEGPRATAFRRAGLSLIRRLDVWQELPRWHEPDAVAAASVDAPPDCGRLARVLSEIEREREVAPPDSNWRQYLQLDSLHRLANGNEAAPTAEQQRTIALVLSRLERTGLSSTGAARPTPWTRLHGELRRWIGTPVEPRQMLFDLEQFESSSLSSDGRRVADEARRLACAGGQRQQALAATLTAHYRNANLRVAISRELLDRMVQAQPPRDAYVRDSVLGNPTRGWSTTWTDVGFRLIPDPHRARLLLEAHGRIASDTVTSNLFVRLRSQSDSHFLASKELEIGLSGLRSQPAWAEADTAPRLRSVETEIDFIPVLGVVAQSMAEAEYEDKSPRVRLEARQKISRRVREEMDRELAGRIQRANEKFRDYVLAPLAQLELTPELIEAQTSEQRVTLRVRLASDEQLAGHGARPRAPSDSLASFQIHQSVLNNIAERLGWNGKTFTLPELRAEAARRLKRELAVSADTAEHHDLSVTFAAENAVSVRCHEGRIELTLAFAQLKLKRDVWHDFSVRVFYRPESDNPEGQLARDGTVQLIGERLNTRAQIALRSIFSKAFHASRKLTILPASALASRPELATLRVAQLDIQDEWIGLALAARPTVAASTPAATTAARP
ncbi:MAG TPA: hypothetical protein VHZ24_05080 [Pirellulales bacterium]|jgi:hypothetical protein|nr:hypothetical protein [Pirellulales bacterium]